MAAASEPDASTTLAFAAPASVGGSLGLAGGTWLSLDGASPDAWGLRLDFGSTGQALEGTNWTTYVSRTQSPLSEGRIPIGKEETPLAFRGMASLELLSRPGENASLYLHAREVAVRTETSLADLHVAHGMRHDRFHADVDGSRYRHPEAPLQDGAALLIRGAAVSQGSFAFEARGVDHVAWFNMEARCLPAGAVCPNGSGLHETGAEVPAMDAGFGVEAYSLHGFAGVATPLAAVGEATTLSGTVLVGGAAPSLGIQGWARLPHATWGKACEACAAAPNGTLSLSGQFELSDLSRTQHGAFQASLSGQVLAARLDERGIPPSSILAGAATTAVAGLGALLLAKAVAAILAWRKGAADHPRRRQLAQLIESHPGMSFRDILRASGLANGVAQHHLKALARQGAVVVQRHGRSVRYFENHGRYRASWRRAIAERSVTESALLALVRERPGSRQADLIELLQARHAWRRSTAQHRLRRLERAGLLGASRKGREIRYWVA